MPIQNEQQQTSANSPPGKPSSFFLTVLRGQTTNVLHMDNSIVDFQVISPSPHIAGKFDQKNTLRQKPIFVRLDVPDPSAVVVLLENDLVVIDLKTEK